jgi:diacylglycerol kinase (ATP)
MPDPRPFTLSARFASFRYAARGLATLLAREHNARVHLAATAGVTATALALRLAAAEWRWLILAIALVWMAEAVNTALEVLCDRLHPGLDAGIGRVKDLAAGAVLIASIAAALIGGLTLLPALLERRP